MRSGYAIAHCDIAEQYYRLTLENDGSTVVDFNLEPGAGRAEGIPTPKMLTGAALRSCPICGSRRVAGCGCARRVLPCEPLPGFRFSCVYCEHLRILTMVKE